MEIGRRPYTTRARLYPDSTQEVDIVWFPARDDMPFLRGPNAINSLEWEVDRDEWAPTVVGEVWGAPRTYNHQRVKLLANGGHVCGTPDDFAGAGKFDGTSAPVTYRPDGLPWCCGLKNMGAGGLVLGGTATVFIDRIQTGSGGLVLGGTATVTFQGPQVGSGGLVLGGSATAGSGVPQTGSGGLVLGGSAQILGGAQGSGGLVLGGTATVSMGTPAPPPSDACSTAPAVSLNVWYEYTVSAAGHWWWRLDPNPGSGAPWHLDTQGLPDPLALVVGNVDRGDDCEFLQFVEVTGDCTDAPDVGTLLLFVLVVTVADSQVIRFRFNPGPC